MLKLNTANTIAAEAQPETTGVLQPSPEQAAIIEFVRSDFRNLMVDAAPGSGKSTTIGMAARVLPMGKLYIALAFNKSAAEAFVSKLPLHVQSGTWHSVCLAAIRLSRPRLRVKADKVKFILKDNFPDMKWEEMAPTIKLVSLLKQIPSTLDDDSVLELADAFSVEGFELSRVRATLDASDNDLLSLDFDDMLRFALHDDVVFPRYGLIFVDEAQDTNAVQRSILAKLNARTVVVGDPYQSIYGFRGADHNAMQELRSMLDACVLPLSVSHRCPQLVVSEAQRVLADKRFTLGSRTCAQAEGGLSDESPLGNPDAVTLRDLAKPSAKELYDSL